MKILLIAMAESIHTAKWIVQIIDQGWEIHLFPSLDTGKSHQDLKSVTIYHSFYSKKENCGSKIDLHGCNIFHPDLAAGAIFAKRHFRPNYRDRQLARLIKKIRPDIIHSMEFQSAGYLVLSAKRILGEKFPFPKWVATNWGSDIYLFGRLPKHRPKIQEILKSCNYYSCECERDVALAQKYGLKSPVLPVFPNSGGLNLGEIKKYRRRGPISRRKVIAIKGYTETFGRATFALAALRHCVELLSGYEIKIYSAEKDDIVFAGELFAAETGIPVSFLPLRSPHREVLKIHGQARISIGLSISDAISTSVLEAMAMGSFPIQSNTSCANEWFTNGKSGLLVPPEDPETISLAIKKSLTNDRLVDSAAKINWQTVSKRLDQRKIKKETIDFYQKVYKSEND